MKKEYFEPEFDLVRFSLSTALLADNLTYSAETPNPDIGGGDDGGDEFEW